VGTTVEVCEDLFNYYVYTERSGMSLYSEVAKVNVRHTGAGMLTGQLQAREIHISGSNGSKLG